MTSEEYIKARATLLRLRRQVDLAMDIPIDSFRDSRTPLVAGNFVVGDFLVTDTTVDGSDPRILDLLLQALGKRIQEEGIR